MAENDRSGTRKNDHVLPPGYYLYVQDGTKGLVKINVGPLQVTISGSDVPMVFNEVGEFVEVVTLKEAVKKVVFVPEGSYVVLTNPAFDKAGKIVFPQEATATVAVPDLTHGQNVVIQGPKTFALWPGQSAQVIAGHILRSNEYLICRVYNEQAARREWGSAQMVAATPVAPTPGTTPPTGTGVSTSTDPSAPAPAPLPQTEEPPAQLTVGQLIIIKGTEVSFFIPPTGIVVLMDENNNYVRAAVTLEQLEYCILLDEGGTKRFVRGPEVVFPEPTEVFVSTIEKGKDGIERELRKFPAIELNPIQGIHLKATKAHRDPVLGDLNEGQEIFVTGKEYPIYFPSEHQMLVRYDGKPKQFAVVVPEGEGRYVLDRMAAKIALARGPQMLLPDPTNSTIVRRPLTDRESGLWYPGNAEALEYNKALRELARNAPTTRSGSVSEGDFERGTQRRDKTGEALRKGLAGAPGATGPTGPQGAEAVYMMNANMPSPVSHAGVSRSSRTVMDVSGVSASNIGPTGGDEISRSSTFNAPRTLTLNTKYEGAPPIAPYSGYAVMVVNAKGERHVVEWPEKVLLEYDETLEIVAFSTGTPKNPDKIVESVYLCTKNNTVSDEITIETIDLVKMKLKVAYIVNFGGEDKKKWFQLRNYVQYLCDNMRSKLKAKAKTLTVEDIYSDPMPFIRKIALGEEEKGTLFSENGMMITDVQLKDDVVIPDAEIARLLQAAMRETVKRNITLADARRTLAATKETAKIEVETLEVQASTESRRKELETAEIADALAVTLARLKAEVEKHEEEKNSSAAAEAVDDVEHEAKLARDLRTAEQQLSIEKMRQETAIALLMAEADALVKKFTALEGGFSEALLALTSRDSMVKIAEAFAVPKLLGGKDAVDFFGKFFEGTGLGDVMKNLSKHSAGHVNGNGNGNKALPASSTPAG